MSRPRPGSDPVHLLVDSTGLKLCGPGEWLVEKHATRARRSWRKLHIGVDADTGQIIAAELTSNGVDDGSQVGPLLEQIAGPVASFTGDGAYDRNDVYREVCQPDATVIVPPRSSACQVPRQRPRRPARPGPAADRRARPHGLAAGIWLQLACLNGGGYRPLQASDR